MQRRDFLKLAGVTGLAVAAPAAFFKDERSSHAEDRGPYEGPLFLLVNAGGGWDPTSLCDPKGRVNEQEEKPVNLFFRGDIKQSGHILHAPVEGMSAFFDKHYSRLLVINGVDTATNGHDSGSRHVWSGNLAEGHPSLGAMIAATHAGTKAMAYITNGGYDITRDIVARTRFGDAGAIGRIAYPNRLDDNNSFFPEATLSRIQSAQAARLQHLAEHTHLPHAQQSIGSLQLARSSNNELRRLTEYLPELNGSALERQAKVAIAAYKAGLCVAANLSVGGFDTHGNHDQDHYPRLVSLLQGVDGIWTEAERQGVADRLVVVVGSDFGRTPYYNASRGKDHWSVTSMMLMGKGIPGNRVIGATTERHALKTVNPKTLQVEDGGVRITPAHVHKQLRKLAGIPDTAELAQRFPLKVEDLPLFG